jgi:hypothetical protein
MARPLFRLALGAAAIALTVPAAACSSSAAGNKSASAPTASAAPSPADSPRAAGGTVSGKTAQNDKFRWTASTVGYAATVPDDGGKVRKPDDGKRFCLVTTTVKNLSTDDQDVAGLDYKIVDGTGKETIAEGLLTGDPGFPFATQTSLSPGQETTVQMVFEVPNNVKATDLVVGGDFTQPGTGLKIALG